MTKSAYAWHKDPEELAQWLVNKQVAQNSASRTSGVMARAAQLYQRYYGRAFVGNDVTKLARLGEQGELVGLSINHFRNVIQHTLALVTANRLAFDTQAQSTDVSALNACKIGNALLDQLFYNDRIDQAVAQAAELGLMAGTSYISVEWEPCKKLIGADSDGAPVYTGAPKVRAHSIFDVVLTPHLFDFHRQPWVCVREVYSRWDLIELFPELEEEIQALPVIKDIQRFDPFMSEDQDSVFLFKAYHRECPSMPSGRETWFCEGPIVLRDGVNPYCHPAANTPNGGLPIFQFRPAVDYGSAYGHSVAFDIAPIQSMLDVLDSAISTNQDTHAIQNIIVPRTSNLSTTDLPGGNKLVEYDPMTDLPGGGKPEALQLTATPPEVFEYRKELIQQFEVLSGINAVLRGQPQASLISGTALALVATQANAFNSVLENNFVAMAEDVAHFLLYVTSRFQTTEEIVALIGKNKSGEVKEFKGNALNSVRKVKVTLGNHLARTTAGRVEIANSLLTAGVLKTPDAVLEAITTGNIVNALDSAAAEPALIHSENELLLAGKAPTMIALDDHPKHVLSHRSVLFNPKARADKNIITAVLSHIQEHLDQSDLMMAGNPSLFSMITGAPMPMPIPEASSGVGPQAAVPPPADAGATGAQGTPATDKGSQIMPGGESQEGLAQQALQSAENKLAQKS